MKINIKETAKWLVVTICLSINNAHVFGSDSITEIPLGSFGGRPTIDIAIKESEPFTVVIDTGFAGGSLMLSNEKAAELKLKETGKTEMQNMGKGKTLSISQYAGEEVSIGNYQMPLKGISSHTMRIFKKPEDPKGVISAWAFSPGVITFDLGDNTLSVDSKRKLSIDEENTLKLSNDGPLPAFNVSINGKAYEAHIDTGSPVGLSMPLSMKDQFEYLEEPRIVGKAMIPGNISDKWRGQIKGELRIGEIVIKNPTTVFLEPLPWVNVGSAILKNHQVSIDIENELIQFN